MIIKVSLFFSVLIVIASIASASINPAPVAPELIVAASDLEDSYSSSYSSSSSDDDYDYDYDYDFKDIESGKKYRFEVIHRRMRKYEYPQACRERGMERAQITSKNFKKALKAIKLSGHRSAWIKSVTTDWKVFKGVRKYLKTKDLDDGCVRVHYAKRGTYETHKK